MPTRSPTPAPTRCSARPASATSGCTSPTPTRDGRVPTRWRLLRHVAAMLAEDGWRVSNVDCAVVCERPKLAPNRDEMQRNLSAAVGRTGDREGQSSRATRCDRARRGHRMLRDRADPPLGGAVMSTGRSSGRGKPSGGRSAGGRPAGGKPSGGQAPGGKPSGGKPSGGRSSGGRSSGGRSSGGQRSSGRPAGRRPNVLPGNPGAAKGLGGRQVEGRQAVRELLIAERRKVHEVWISAELEGDDGVADIVEIAAARRIPLLHVARAKLEREARSEAPQGVLAHAAETAGGRSRCTVGCPWRRPHGAVPGRGRRCDRPRQSRRDRSQL